MNARYEIYYTPKNPAECAVIRDVGHRSGKSVTNDVDAVTANMLKQKLIRPKGDDRFLYYDSDDVLTAVNTNDGQFVTFGPPTLEESGRFDRGARRN